MSVIPDKIALSTTLQQYWQLLRIMLFNLKTIGYVVAIFLSIGILALISILTFGTHSMGMVLATLSFAIVIFVVGMWLPVGMVIVISNRHISMVGNLRHKLFHISFICGFLASITISSVILDAKREIPVIDFSLLVMIICAIYFWVATYLGSKNSSIALLAPLIAVFLSYFIADVLKKMPITHLGLANLVVWYLFYRWWMSFNPYGSPNKINLLSLSHLNDPKNFAWVPFGGANKVRTSIGSLLLGYGDSYMAFFQRIGMTYLIACASSFYIFGVFKDGASSDNLIKAFMAGVGYSLVIVGVDFFGARVINRLKRNWLFFAGNREGIFLYIEKFFWQVWVSITGFSLLIVIALLVMLSQYQYIVFGVRAIVILALLLILNFYRDIYTYQNRKATGEINVLKIIVNLIPFLAALYYLVSKYEHPNDFEWKDYFALLVILAAVFLMKLIRIECIKKWKSIDL